MRVYVQSLDVNKAVKRKLPRIGGCFETALFSGVIVQRSLHRCCGLTEGFVTDGMNLDLKAEAVGFFAKFDDPFIRLAR